jgi:hypothetical protein
MKADIPYRVAQVPEERDGNMRVVWRYEIGVLGEDYERAKELLGFEGEFAETRDGPDDDNDADEADERYSLPLDDSPPGQAIRNEAFLKPWYPEDATVEIWAQNGDDLSSGIQMALKENQIHCVVDLHGGIRKVLVTPEDEPRARQIVREIIEGVELE